MTGAVAEIHEAVPVVGLDDRINEVARDAIGESLAGKCNVRFERHRVVVLHFIGKLSDSHRSGEIGCAAEVLRANVKK